MLRTEELQAQLLEAQRQETKDQRTFIQDQLDYHRRLIIHYDEAATGETEAVERECAQRIERTRNYFAELKSNSETVIADLESRLRKLTTAAVLPPGLRSTAAISPAERQVA